MKDAEYRAYLGKGGQLAVMAHIVTRGYNVAIPEIDIGSDIFVVRDSGSVLWPVQVKTTRARETADGSLSGRFTLSESQLRNAPTPDDLFFSLVFFHQGTWRGFVNLSRQELDNATAGMVGTGKANRKVIKPVFRLTTTSVLCNGTDLQRFRDNWDTWPDLRPGLTR